MPRTVDCACTQISLSRLKSKVQGAAHVPTPLVVCARSACNGSYAFFSAPPLSRTFVFHVELASWSTFAKLAFDEPASVAALGHLSLAAPPDVHVAG